MTTTARVTPPDAAMKEGFSTLIAFAEDPDINFWERDVQPGGTDNGDEINITTMHNSDWRTKAPRKLNEITEGQSTVGYATSVLPQLRALVGVNGWYTIHYPDGSTEDLLGYIKSFEPDSLQEGEYPTATMTFVTTNDDDGTETGPTYTAPA